MGRKTVLVISFSLDRDPRVNRQIRFLSESYEIIAVGYGRPLIENITSVSVAPQPQIPWLEKSGVSCVF
jgi:hypothetical protein